MEADTLYGIVQNFENQINKFGLFDFEKKR